MSRNILILGVGASVDAGAPLMRDFLDVALKFHEDNPGHSDSDAFALVFRGVGELQKVQAKATLDIQNLEHVFAAFETAAIIRRLGEIGSEETPRLVPSLRRVITRVLEEEVRFPTSDKRVVPPPSYDQLVRQLMKPARNGEDLWHRTSILTFNYDLALDYTLQFHGIPVSYATTEQKSDGRSLNLYRLHGSLNWLQCGECDGGIKTWSPSSFFARFDSTPHLFSDDDPKPIKYNISKALPQLEHKHESTKTDALIVPPTWNKGQYIEGLGNVWRHAADEFRDAENIAVIGHSLPETDQFIRQLFGVGSISNTWIKSFVVVDPSEEARDRYRKLVGSSVVPRFREIPTTFMNAIDTVFETFLAS